MSLRCYNISFWTSTYPFLALKRQLRAHTWFGQRNQVCHILHEDATLELKLGLATLVNQGFGGKLVLRLAEINVFATQQDCFEKIDVILRIMSVDLRIRPGLPIASYLSLGVLAIGQVLALQHSENAIHQ